MTIVFFGDSITQGGGNGGWVDHLQEQLSPSHGLVNAGVGGDTSAMALDRFARDVAPHGADIVVIEFGINDCYVPSERAIARVSHDEYRRNLREIVRLVKGQGALPIMVVNHLPQTRGAEHTQGNGAPLEANLSPYNQTAREVAGEEGLALVDFPASFSPDQSGQLLNGDKVHLSEAGQRLYAQGILAVLLPLLNDHAN